MSLKLQSAPPAAAAPGPAIAGAGRPQPARRITLLDRLGSRPALWAVMALALTLCGWTVFFRASQLRTPIEARARSVAVAGSALIDGHELAGLAREEQRVREHLLPSRVAFLEAVRELEAAAATNGWIVQTTLQTPVGPPVGGGKLERIPATIQLRDRSGIVAGHSAFDRLLPLIAALAPERRRIDIIRLEARGGRIGLAEVTLELHFWLNQSHEKTAAE